jgi:hypothetical protein
MPAKCLGIHNEAKRCERSRLRLLHSDFQPTRRTFSWWATKGEHMKFALLRDGVPIAHAEDSDNSCLPVLAVWVEAGVALAGDTIWSGPCQPCSDSAAGDAAWRHQGNTFIGELAEGPSGMELHCGGDVYDARTGQQLRERGYIPYVAMFGDGMNGGSR